MQMQQRDVQLRLRIALIGGEAERRDIELVAGDDGAQRREPLGVEEMEYRSVMVAFEPPRSIVIFSSFFAGPSASSIV